jgi:hypothetical protein
MRIKLFVFLALAGLCCLPVMAELQNVEVGGSVRIRGNYYDLDSLGDMSFVEQRTRLGVKSDFTDNVSTMIEFDYYNYWGEDFRSLYLTGADFRGGGGNDVDLYQGYINVANMWGTPLHLRVGRQEFNLGNAFFIGLGDESAFFTGTSYDAVLLSYITETFMIHACAAKTVEQMGNFLSNDADLFGLYATCLAVEDVVFDAYWLFVRDDVALVGSKNNIHTLGLRGAGAIGAFDFELEAAYQFGGGEDMPPRADVDYDEFGVNAELGYTFDMAWQPRVFARFAYLGGGDPDDSCWNNDVVMPFNRLGSNIKYSEFLDNDPTSNLKATLSNVLFYSLGVQANPTECLSLKLVGAYFDVDEEARRGWWFWRNDADSTLGWEVGLYADYNYSEDLVFRAGYAHFFGDDGLEGNAIIGNGLAVWNGDEDDDYDYLFIETELCF